MHDPAVLAEALMTTLAPALPYLVSSGRGAPQPEEKPGSLVWENAREIWRQVGPKVEEKPAAAEAAADVAADPEDGDARAALRRQLRKILAADASLAAEVARLLETNVRGDVPAAMDRRSRLRELLEFEGKMPWEGDLDVLRGRRGEA